MEGGGRIAQMGKEGGNKLWVDSKGEIWQEGGSTYIGRRKSKLWKN